MNLIAIVAAFLLATPTLASAPAAAEATAPIEIHDEHVYVRVDLAGARPLWFLVDSGAATPVNLIAKQTADRLGLKGAGEQQAGAIGGSVKLTFTPPLSLRIGVVELPAERLAIIPLDEDGQEGHAVDGILGYAFFRAFDPEIDYPHRLMRLGASPTGRRGGVTQLRIVDKNCVIDAEIVLAPGRAPTRVRLVVDTGYDGGLLLTSPFVVKHDLLERAGAAASGKALGGVTTRHRFVVPRLSIGSVSERRLNASLSTDRDGAFASADVDGYVGGAFLKHYIVLFDYAGGRFVLTPSANRTGR